MGNYQQSVDGGKVGAYLVLVVVVGLFLGGGCWGIAWGIPTYRVWQQGMSGKSELAKAESNRQIAIAEARAKMESSKLLAESEVIRAEGVARANRIIGESLNKNEAYLHYLWIQELGNSGHVIYVPTEANMPIMEAGRINALSGKE